MRLASLIVGLALAGCGGPKQFDSLCEDRPAPAECMVACDATPGAPQTCPDGYHCAADGRCDAQCTRGGSECGDGFECTDDGRCVAVGGGSGSDGTPEYCKHIDVVIAVDNSGSMQEEKAALRDIAFPGFAQALKNVAGGIEDFRVGVVDACPDPANYHTRGVSGACNFASGQVWMDSSSASLVDEFKCVGDVFSGDQNCTGDNDDEQPATAATVSLEAAYQAPGMPNAGFMREEALLVVVAITDEDEQPTPNVGAQAIYDRLVAAKGDPNRVVFLGIGGASDCMGAYGTAKNATKLRNATDVFIQNGRGVFWDLCQGNLDQGLMQALETIDQACRDFGPIL